MSTNGTSRRPLWKRLGLNAFVLSISVLFCVGFAEVGVRLVAPQQLIVIRPDLWEPADTVGWLRRPNVNSTINTGERTVRLLTDQDGFRIGERGRAEGVPVLLLGDSFVEALQVDHEQSLAGRLEQTLTTALGTQAAVRNAGISGWAPGQYLARARTLLPLEPYRAVVVGLYVGNDVRTTREDYLPPKPITERHRFRMPHALSKSELVRATLLPLNDALEVRSHLFVFTRAQLEPLRRKAGLSANYFPAEFTKREAAVDRWDITADVCRDIAELAAAHGAHALFVLIPADFQVDSASFQQHVAGFGIDPNSVDLDQPSRRMAQELTDRGLRTIDALPAFRERHDAGHRLYGTVDKHLSPDGHAALAELVTPELARLLMPATPASPSGARRQGASSPPPRTAGR